MAGPGIMRTWRSTSWDTPSNLVWRRIAGECFVGFLPAISAKAATAIRTTIREWRLASTRNNQRLEDLAQFVNPKIRGWVHYYGRFYRSKCVHVESMRPCTAGAHCATGPAALCPVQLCRSRMRRESHVRFWESPEVR